MRDHHTRRPRTGRPGSAPPYYLGRPAGLWIAAMRRRRGDAPATRTQDPD